MSNGTQIHQWDFHGGSTQQWTFTHLGDGYYSIKSANSSTPYYLGVSGDSTDNNAPIVLRNGTLTDGMKWKISKTSSGAYKITPKTGEANNRVLAVGWYVLDINGIDIEQRDYVNDSNYKDEWVLYGQCDYTLMYIGYNVGDPLMPPIVNAVGTALEDNASMKGNRFTSLTKKELLVHLSSSYIFSCITHGLQTQIATTDGYVTTSDIDALSDSAFEDLKFVYFGACNTGKGRGGENNLVNAVHNKGADAVLGFTDEIFTSEANLWTEVFMTTLSTGVSLRTAMNDADIAVRNATNIQVPFYSTGSSYRYLVGSDQLIPCN